MLVCADITFTKPYTQPTLTLTKGRTVPILHIKVWLQGLRKTTASYIKPFAAPEGTKGNLINCFNGNWLQLETTNLKMGKICEREERSEVIRFPFLQTSA